MEDINIRNLFSPSSSYTSSSYNILCHTTKAVGSFRETMRELADDLMLSSDTQIIVDSKESAMKEAGEIIQSKAKIMAELGELIHNDKFSNDICNEKITIFKSVGIAVEDLAAAIVLYQSLKK
ncbi:unnamed protein product [Rotaria sordida]|uniref:Uncharacterized protein n=2 Tax=Rotaria sordida TaxID=392033 RepID=A0A815IL99_9BILA|nr:unnamed protein product [Rotaria sordida]